MRRAVTLAALGVAACVDIIGIHDLPDGAVASDAASDGSTTDAPVSGCDPTKPFTTQNPVLGLTPSGGGVLGVMIAPNQLTAYVCVAPGNLYLASRSMAVGIFTPATKPAATGVCDVTSTLDGLTIAWSTGLSTSSHLFRETRGVASAFDFDAGTPLTGLDVGNTNGETSPFIRADGQVLYYVVPATPAGVFRALADSGFQTSTQVMELPNDTYSAIVTADDLVIYFDQMATLQVGTRTDVSKPFGNFSAVMLPDSGLGGTPLPILVTEDRCTLYYSLQTTTADGGQLITVFVSTKTP